MEDDWPPLELYLSSSSENPTDWAVDGFLLLESFSTDGLFTRAVVGDVDSVNDGSGALVTRLGRKSRHFTAKELNVSGLLAPREETHLRIQVLTYGDSGSVSDLYLIRSPL